MFVRECQTALPQTHMNGWYITYIDVQTGYLNWNNSNNIFFFLKF